MTAVEFLFHFDWPISSSISNKLQKIHTGTYIIYTVHYINIITHVNKTH